LAAAWAAKNGVIRRAAASNGAGALPMSGIIPLVAGTLLGCCAIALSFDRRQTLR
jgi:hypothetical protein